MKKTGMITASSHKLMSLDGAARKHRSGDFVDCSEESRVMAMEVLRSLVTRRPVWVVITWISVAAVTSLFAPNLTRLAAEGQANLLNRDAESFKASEALRLAWPDQAYESLVVAALYRSSGLTAVDYGFAQRLADRIVADDRPKTILRVLSPNASPEVAARLRSKDGTVALVAVPLFTSFVAPATHEAAAWLQLQARSRELDCPPGLEVRWAGDALIGRDYMRNVQTSLDRAAVATVVLLLVVLFVVYRSFWLATIPIVAIGMSLVIARSILAWMTLAGWEVSPLVELFLIALLFGCGTDFCLFVSWRFGEHWDASDPARAMRATLARSSSTLLTSGGTVIVGLSLMGTTRFKLFSTTGPSVAIGLAITLAAALTLTPGLLIIVARLRPRAFDGLTAPSSGLWKRVAGAALARPIVSWLVTVLLMVPLGILGLRSSFVQDVMTEMPGATTSVKNLRWLGTKFDTGSLAPLTVMLDSDTDLKGSEGLAMIDDVSRFLGRQQRILEVRSATQPLGSNVALNPARLSERFRALNVGNGLIESGARLLQKGLNEGAAKLRAALWLEERTGIPIGGSADQTRAALATNLRQLWGGTVTQSGTSRQPDLAPRSDEPRSLLLRELGRAADGAGRIAAGAAQACHEVSAILDDPVGRRALDHLMISAETVHAHPELLRSFRAYIAPDGRRSQIVLTQADRIYSAAAMDQVETLRRRTNDFLKDFESLHVTARISGENAEAADIRALIRSDQVQSWYVVPVGVCFVLLLSLRDPMACVNLVATMVLTYAFALGATHLLFVTFLGAAGIDWKVPYFLFVLLVAVGVDYNVFLMVRVREESHRLQLRAAMIHAVGQTGGLITSAAAITACSFASFLFSPLSSLRQLGFALVVGIMVDALIVRPLLVPCGHWLLKRRSNVHQRAIAVPTATFCVKEPPRLAV
jgi:putative drug exporter of the RND superfamily